MTSRLATLSDAARHVAAIGGLVCVGSGLVIAGRVGVALAQGVAVRPPEEFVVSKNSIDFKAHHYAQELVTRFQASAFGQRDIVVRRMWGTGKHADTESFRYTVHLRQPLSAHSKYAFVFTTDWTTTTDGAVSALTGVECGEGALLNSTDDVRLYTHLVLRQVGKDWAFEGIYRSPGHPNAAIIGAAAKPGPHVATLDRSKPRHVISQMAMMIYDATRGELGHFGPAFTQPAGTTHPSIIK